MPKLSIVSPVYNPDMTLFPKVLKALVAQSLKDWEYIAVLDGYWPEAEKEIHKAFKKTACPYHIVQLEHGGAQKARNEGFKRSSGDYVVLFDSDCVVEPDAAKMWVDTFDRDKEVSFIYSGYKFLNEKGAIVSEPFDPWTLRVRNYISMCFPFRRELFVPLNEELESFQDWDFWLSLVEKGAKGKYIPGFAFSTSFPTPDSISGKGTVQEKWLDRMDKVKALHNIPIKDVCITSINYRLDAILLAKAMNVDYHDDPNFKPNHYKKIIQLGFSINPKDFEKAAKAWGAQHEKVIFWTAEDIEALYDTVSQRGLDLYTGRINKLGKQFVEDKKGLELMTKMGFTASVLPLPVISSKEIKPLPEHPKFLVDISPDYGHAFTALEKAIPDIELEASGGVQKIENYTGYICFYRDRLLRPDIKRMLGAGRHLVTNIQTPFGGYLDDQVSDGKFVKSMVERLRELVTAPQSVEQVNYWLDPKRLTALQGAI